MGQFITFLEVEGNMQYSSLA